MTEPNHTHIDPAEDVTDPPVEFERDLVWPNLEALFATATILNLRAEYGPIWERDRTLEAERAVLGVIASANLIVNGDEVSSDITKAQESVRHMLRSKALASMERAESLDSMSTNDGVDSGAGLPQ